MTGNTPVLATPSIRLLLWSIPICFGLMSCNSELPTRSECIVKVITNDPAATRFRHGGLHPLMPLAYQKELPLAGYAVASPDVAYLQYRRHCSERLEMSGALLSEIFPPGTYAISEGQVAPSPKTIDLIGSSWRDRPEGWDR